MTRRRSARLPFAFFFAFFFAAALEGVFFGISPRRAAAETPPIQSSFQSAFQSSLQRADIRFLAEGETALYPLPDRFPLAESIQAETNGAPLVPGVDFRYRAASNALLFTPPLPKGAAVRIRYRKLEWEAPRRFERNIFEGGALNPARRPAASANRLPAQAPFDPNLLRVTGAKTFGLSAGNRRSFAPDQSLHLNIDGEILPGVLVSAALTDQQLPFQPDGTAENIAQLDQTRIALRSDAVEAAVGEGELELEGPQLVLFKRPALGFRAAADLRNFHLQAAAALPRGVSDSVSIVAEEGRSEYRAAPAGRYVVMIAGSETVWLNGERMVRGENNDYVIRDYGDPVVEFTPKRLLTRNDIIRVDYEYIPEEEGWQRSLYAGRAAAKLEERRGEIGVSYAVETDDKTRPVALLAEEEMELLRQGRTETDAGKRLQPPTQRQIAAVDARFQPADFAQIEGEWALQRLLTNALARNPETRTSGAWRVQASAETERAAARGEAERLERGYLPIGAAGQSRRANRYAADFANEAFGDARLGTGYSVQGGDEPPEETRWSAQGRVSPADGLTLQANGGRSEEKHANRAFNASRYQMGAGAAFQPTNQQTNLQTRLPTVELRRRESGQRREDLYDAYRKAENGWTIAHALYGVRAEAEGSRFLSQNLQNAPNDAAETDAPSRFADRNLRQHTDRFSLSTRFGTARFETEREAKRSENGVWKPSSAAQTYRYDLRRRFGSVSFGRRTLQLLDGDEQSGSSSAVALLDGRASPLQGAMQLAARLEIDKRLSSKREEVYTNEIIVNGSPVLLQPGQGVYVKVDEHTYVEDPAEGDHVRLVRTVGDLPAGALEAQVSARIDPSRLLSRPAPPGAEGISEIRGAGLAEAAQAVLNALSCSARWSVSEEQEDAGFQELFRWRNFRGESSVYGQTAAQIRASAQIGPPLLMDAGWTDRTALNRRFNNETRRTDAESTRLRTQWNLAERWTMDAETERRTSRTQIAGDSDLRRVERLRAAAARFQWKPPWTLGLRLERDTETASEISYAADMIGETSGSSLTQAAEISAAWAAFGKGRADITLRIADGSSAGQLPALSAFRFYEGISREIRASAEYRIRSWTDLTFRTNYRMLDAQDRPVEHRFDLELTAEL